MKIQVLGTGCPKCKLVEANARQAVQETGKTAEIEKVTDINKIIDFGVMATPALAIDGKVVCSGRIPDKEEIKKWLG
jgi:small redox-active disulfide protein 2